MQQNQQVLIEWEGWTEGGREGEGSKGRRVREGGTVDDGVMREREKKG